LAIGIPQSIVRRARLQKLAVGRKFGYNVAISFSGG
jgi:hypothetical protein